eukprot:GHVU01184681.1.p1 GENE.GHVU01184681.1~~GHVU01184681.1.p1  ORF type:complete len:140 (-),score=16.57 GHVU01184681.1:168-587(-)
MYSRTYMRGGGGGCTHSLAHSECSSESIHPIEYVSSVRAAPGDGRVRCDTADSAAAALALLLSLSLSLSISHSLAHAQTEGDFRFNGRRCIGGWMHRRRVENGSMVGGLSMTDWVVIDGWMGGWVRGNEEMPNIDVRQS